MTSATRLWTCAAAAVWLGFAAILIRLAWVGDDTYITLRTVENFLAGHGLVWNLGERVQTYTHPLWLFVLAAMRWATGEAYFGTLAISFVLALGSAALLMRLAGPGKGAVAIGVLLVCSRSFPEFAVCGLENPLAFLLLAGFGATATGVAAPANRIRRTALLAALAATTRLDLGLLCAPVLLANGRGQSLRGWLGGTTLGMVPLLAWLAFAAIYYGSPFPITALAKATHLGIAAADLWQQGLYFLEYVWRRDAVTMLAITAAIGIGLVRGPAGTRPLAVGLVLYLLYVTAIGGDFMGGRFTTPPFTLAVVILARTLRERSAPWSAATAALALAAMVWSGLPDWTHGPAKDTPPTEDFHAIVDERRAYYGPHGLLSPTRDIPAPGGLTQSLRAMGRTAPLVMIYGIAGRDPFVAGELLHAVDHCLLDPLQMRLPVPDPKRWRIGHFVRQMPEGYLESLAQDRNLVHHPGLARYYGNLRTVIDARVPLFAPERLQALWHLWRGTYAADLQDYVDSDYRNPPQLPVAAAELAKALPNSPLGGPHWFDHPQARLVQRGGLRVQFAAPVAAQRLELQLQGGRELVYRLRFHRGEQQLAEQRVDASALPVVAGMQPFACACPVGEPFDAVVVDVPNLPLDMVAAVGSLRAIP
ncbi:MAG: hypothetical protein JNK49_03110 [Planctomycetes bacterium]|nr:hypothetical protein [Planctomycetota bacterium]